MTETKDVCFECGSPAVAYCDHMYLLRHVREFPKPHEVAKCERPMCASHATTDSAYHLSGVGKRGPLNDTIDYCSEHAKAENHIERVDQFPEGVAP